MMKASRRFPMGIGRSAILAAGLVLGLGSLADVPVVHTDNVDLNIGGMAQLLGFAQQVNDPVKNSDRLYLFVKEARFRLTGRYDEVLFRAELAIGGEDTVAAPNPGVTLGVLDLRADIPLHFAGRSFLTVGQFKVPYGREGLTYSGELSQVDRSVEYLGFRVGRDVGAAVTLRPGPATLIAGVFTGGGRDLPPDHYLPQTLGIPLVVVRAGIGDLDDDPYLLKQQTFGADRPRWAAFLNGLYTKDSIVGHSTALNVKLVDKSLLLNSNWNPFIATEPLTQGTWWQLGFDAAMRTPISSTMNFSAEAQVDWAGFSNAYGEVHVAGGRAQAALGWHRVEVALRYSVLFPDKAFSIGPSPITGTDPIHEITPAVTWAVAGERLKLVFDVPVLIGVPVFLEPKVGSYVSSELPDEASVLARGGSVSRQNVIEGRLMLQLAL